MTLRAAVCRARPPAKPTRPERAPFDSPSSACGTFTLRDTMLTMRPNPRAVMPSTVSRIISIGPSIMSSRAAIQSSRDQSRKLPGSGPCELFTRISGAAQAPTAAARPCGVVRSAATGDNLHAGRLRNFGAGAFKHVAGAGNDREIDAFPRQRQRAGLAETPARAADQRAFASYAEVHFARQAATAERALSL